MLIIFGFEGLAEEASMSFMKRTHNCGELRIENAGTETTLNGWVDSRRDHGGVVFIDLRDRWGKTQVVFDPEVSPEIHSMAHTLRAEHVISVQGKVRPRLEGMVNEKFATGEIEVYAGKLEVLSRSDSPPFPIEDDADIGMDTRMKYRFLDLRRPSMLKNMILRHKMIARMRTYLDALDFIDIETPMLSKSTPEGARDYLVPSRVNENQFFALPQSPQLLKQILMVAGYERYYQVVKCFRDEDLRADRQPEFTQLDMEMAFCDEEDVMNVIEGLLIETFKDVFGVELTNPIPRMPYDEAMLHYGSDAPDLRYGMLIQDISDLAGKTDFRVFKGAVEGGGCVRSLAIPEGSKFTRKELDDMVVRAQEIGAKGLAWIKWTDDGFQSPIVKFIPEDVLNGIIDKVGAKAGDVMIFVADSVDVAVNVLGTLRCELAQKLGLVDKFKFEPVWIVDFPLFEKDDAGNPTPSHHPFTAPKAEDLDKLDSDPLSVKARAYDIVLNGTEIGGGSIRIHQGDLQQRIFSLLGIGPEDALIKFGFLLEAFKYGAPPHGGLALGLDRVAMLALGHDSIREVIAFPKTQRAQCLLTGAPSEVDDRQLKELHIKLASED